MFDNGAKEYFKKYGGGVDHLAMIGESWLKLLGGALQLSSCSVQEPQALCQQPLLAIPRWLER